MNKMSIAPLTVAMLSVSLLQADKGAALDAMATLIKEPTAVGAALRQVFHTPTVTLGIMNPIVLRKDILEEAIAKNNPTEVEKIIASGAFTQAEKDAYIRKSQENIMKVKPGLRPRFSMTDFLKLSGGLALTAGGITAIIVGLKESGIGKAIRDYRSEKNYYARRQREYGSAVAEATSGSDVHISAPRPAYGQRNTAEHEGSSYTQTVLAVHGLERKGFFGHLWKNFNPLTGLGFPIVGAIATRYGVRTIARYFNGYYEQQAYDKAIAIDGLIKAIVVKA